MSASPIAFGTQKKVNAAGMGIADGTSPCVVTFLGSTYLFFAGDGGNGIWMTSSNDGVSWTTVSQIVPPNAKWLGIAANTSPAAIAVESPAPRLFLFYTGNGNNGVFFSTTADGSTWTDVAQIVPPSQQWVPILASTSPCALLAQDRIHLYFSGIQSDAVYTMVATSDSPGADAASWSASVPIVESKVAPGANPSAVFFDDKYYVFYVVPGTAANSLWYVTSVDGMSWDAPQPVTVPSSVSNGASPTAFVADSRLYLLWFAPTGLQATATSDGDSWEPVSSYADSQSGTQVFSLPTNASGVVIGDEATLFWT
ncbi:MAG: hypothetical protein M3Q69_21120, partial [Acidobacteriota bacterium]|nr:hypothetical protein [Acidobacteriota bacterium]